LLGKKKPEAQSPQQESARAVMARSAYCRVCKADTQFTRCWLRIRPLQKCPCCGQQFDNPAALYARNQPACPRCGEYLEAQGFEYGLCDGCGSKYELVPNTKPSLIPNKKQRDEMNKVGKSWSPD
jgi:hypothetical protein